MVNKRNSFIVFSFVVSTVFLLIISINIQIEVKNEVETLDIEKIETTTFSKANYYFLKNKKKSFYTYADEINLHGKDVIDLEAPDGHFYNEDETKSLFKGDRGNYIFSSSVLNLINNVKLVSQKGEFLSETLTYNFNKEIVEANEDVRSFVLVDKTLDRIFLSGNSLKLNLKNDELTLSGNVKGELKRRKIYEGGYNFSSNQLSYSGQEALMKLNENVRLDRNNYKLSGGRAEIFLENYNKKLKYYAMYDDIRLTEEITVRDQKDTRRAYSEKLEGFISDELIVLSGAPRVEQGLDVIKGYEIKLRENNEIVEVDNSQTSFYLNKKGNAD